MTPSSQCEVHAHDGPPCTLTTRGYFLPGAKSLGSSSHPCTRVVPLFQCTLRISPQAGCTALFKLVSRFQPPIGPAQTSGGELANWRTTAVTDPSWENEPPGTQAALVVAASSSPVQSVRTAPPLVLMVAKLELPSAFWAKAMRSEDIHASAEGDVVLWGVRFRAVPPCVGTIWISPPVRPASLINPSIKATFFPSGETRGCA